MGAGHQEWPAPIRGITESVVTTRQPAGVWNAAALGLIEGAPVAARTWGSTRTRRNFHREGEGYVQFVRDPVVFIESALGIHESPDPVLEAADAWIRVRVKPADRGVERGVEWEKWLVHPVDSRVVTEPGVCTINRGFNAVIEASVAASRLGVPGYDAEALRARIDSLEDVVDRCGGARDREAFRRLRSYAES